MLGLSALVGEARECCLHMARAVVDDLHRGTHGKLLLRVAGEHIFRLSNSLRAFSVIVCE